MKDTYEYTISSTLIWTSFDFGEVEANSVEEAKDDRIPKLLRRWYARKGSQ